MPAPLNGEMHVAPNPCKSCPYRRDTPPGVWSAEEYEKLREYDDNPLHLAVFLCHQTNATGVETACKGWLAVHPDHVAVRVAQMKGHLTPEQVGAPCSVEVYGSGTEAAEAGLAGVKDPSEAAVAMMAKLVESGAGRDSVRRSRSMRNYLGCRCEGKPTERQKNWRVQARHGNHSAFNGYRWQSSAYSRVRCQECGAVWRTKADYVETLPDETEAEEQRHDWSVGS